jgi:hypothetical protein
MAENKRAIGQSLPGPDGKSCDVYKDDHVCVLFDVQDGKKVGYMDHFGIVFNPVQNQSRNFVRKRPASCDVASVAGSL